jgi:3-methyladenine DNA glycosylase AlkC
MNEPLKNLYNKVFLQKLSLEIRKVYKEFDQQAFSRAIFNKDWDSKELKQRMRHITECLHQYLPPDYQSALEILKPVATKFNGFEYMLFPYFVELYGLHDWQNSLPALAHFTKYSSSEFAVRPFILQDEQRMMQQMAKWAQDKNHHLRRLATEGCRPRLPWAMDLANFKKNPSPIIPILEQLKQDPSEYVRRSVANNLNDISKDHPDLILQLSKKLIGNNKQTDWIIKHGCRTLLKLGNTAALSLFGFEKPTELQINKFSLSADTIAIGEDLHFSFELETKSSKLGKLRIEYAIYYVKLSKKVFKISEADYQAQYKKVSKKHSFKDLSTRKHYPGKHKISIIINGCEMAELIVDIIC